MSVGVYNLLTYINPNSLVLCDTVESNWKCLDTAQALLKSLSLTVHLREVHELSVEPFDMRGGKIPVIRITVGKKILTSQIQTILTVKDVTKLLASSCSVHTYKSLEGTDTEEISVTANYDKPVLSIFNCGYSLGMTCGAINYYWQELLNKSKNIARKIPVERSYPLVSVLNTIDAAQHESPMTVSLICEDNIIAIGVTDVIKKQSNLIKREVTGLDISFDGMIIYLSKNNSPNKNRQLSLKDLSILACNGSLVSNICLYQGEIDENTHKCSAVGRYMRVTWQDIIPLLYNNAVLGLSYGLMFPKAFVWIVHMSDKAPAHRVSVKPVKR